MVEFEELEQEDGKEGAKVSQEEARVGDQAGDEASKAKNQRGGAGMKAARRKRNIEGMLERLKRLQRAIKESQKLYYVEQGRAVLKWYQEYKQNRAGVRELEEQLKAVAEMFGKSLDEPVE
jgi:imidazolonepropionase-like amidohydrolase